MCLHVLCWFKGLQQSIEPIIYFSFASYVQLIKKIGLPAMSTFKSWAQQASSSTETFYLLTTMLVGPYRLAWVGIIPMAILAVYHISATLNTAVGNTAMWKTLKGADIHRWLSIHQQGALQYMALMEVGTGIALAFLSISNGLRAVMNTFMYLSHLRNRFWLPESRQSHILAWQMLGRTVAPVLGRVVVLQQIVNYGARWFQAGAPQQQHQA